ncbi:MAG: hypothetical protein NT124_00540 [Candidatus Dependentiae bacterium]|nr:hypothetical protein [Candidatus Dependentiae bacterium]
MIQKKQVLFSLLLVSISISAAPIKTKTDTKDKKITKAKHSKPKHSSDSNTDSTQGFEAVYTPTAQVGTSPGDLDGSFGRQGLKSSQLDLGGSSIYDIAVNTQGKIFTAGRSENNEHFIVTGYTDNGQIDPEFGYNGNGTNIVIFGDTYEPCGANALAIDNTNPANRGKLVVAGYSGNNFGVARYLSNGEFDCTFNSGSSFPGRNTIVFGLPTKKGSTAKSSAHDLAVGSDGSVVMAGETINSATGKKVLSLGKVREDGKTETSFGANGTVMFSLSERFPGIVTPTAIETIEGIGTQTVTEAGRNIPYTVTAGTTEVFNTQQQGGGSRTQGYIARFNPQGEFNANFGPNGNGLVLVNYSAAGFSVASPSSLHDTIIDSENRIVVVGNVQDRDGFDVISIARYLSNGSPDTSFNGTGVQTVPFNRDAEGLSVAFDQLNRILITGVATTDNNGTQEQVVVRLLPDGTIDRNFGTNGLVVTDFDNPSQNSAGRGIIFQPTKNRIIAAGYNNNANGEPYSALAGYRS